MCPPLSTEEYQQLEANILAEGCREPLVVWEEEGLLLDGHNRLAICHEHDIACETRRLSLTTREEAATWIINNQLGRRNLTAEQKSYLRGQRYNREKRQGNRTDLTSPDNQEKLPTDTRLAQEYRVAPSTIQADGQFASAVDTLEDQVRADIRETILKRQERGKQQATKKQVTRAGKLIEEKKVEPLPFMQRTGWKPSQVLQAIEALGTLPTARGEHAATDLQQTMRLPAALYSTVPLSTVFHCSTYRMTFLVAFSLRILCLSSILYYDNSVTHPRGESTHHGTQHQ